MNAIIIFESLVIPAIITFMLIVLFILNKEYVLFKKSGIRKENKYKDKNSVDIANNEKYIDFSGGTWGI